MSGLVSIWVLPAAVLLDFCLGDPRKSPHPIRLMGKIIAWTESRLRRSSLHPRLAGVVLTITMVTGTWQVSKILVLAASLSGNWPRFALETVLIYYCLSARDLDRAGRQVLRSLVTGGKQSARKELRWIVGRQVDDLSVRGILRAAIESVAENLVDGFTAPLFYAAVGGAPLAMAYKMVNTLDSMVGYKTKRYLKLGWASARLDDLANWLPARLSAPVVAIAGQMLAGRGKIALVTVIRQARRHTSPNSGFAEAAFAGVLAVKLGGPNYYHGQKINKPYIGTEFGPAGVFDLARACDLMLASAMLWLFFCVGLGAVFL